MTIAVVPQVFHAYPLRAHLDGFKSGPRGLEADLRPFWFSIRLILRYGPYLSELHIVPALRLGLGKMLRAWIPPPL